MTGRELIQYILSNNLENEPVCTDGVFIGFMPSEKAALELKTGVATVITMYFLGKLDGINVGDNIYISVPSVLKYKNKTEGRSDNE